MDENSKSQNVWFKRHLMGVSLAYIHTRSFFEVVESPSALFFNVLTISANFGCRHATYFVLVKISGLVREGNRYIFFVEAVFYVGFHDGAVSSSIPAESIDGR